MLRLFAFTFLAVGCHTQEPAAPAVPFAVAELLRGPDADERAKGLYSPFDRSVSRVNAPPLHRHARLEIRDGVATVDVDREAAPYLNQAICARTAVTSAIERTLLGLPGVHEVRFAIEGDVIHEWDA